MPTSAVPVPLDETHMLNIHRTVEPVIGLRSFEAIERCLMMTDPMMHQRLFHSDAASQATKAYLSALGNAALRPNSIESNAATADAARELATNAEVIVDDLFTLEDVILMRVDDTCRSMMPAFEATFIVAWEAFLRRIFLYLSGHISTLDFSADVKLATQVRLLQASSATVLPYFTQEHLFRQVENAPEAFFRAAKLLDPTDFATMIARALQVAFDTNALRELLIRAGMTHRSCQLHQHYGHLFKASLQIVQITLRLDFQCVSVELRRQWRRLIRWFHDELTHVNDHIVPLLPPRGGSQEGSVRSVSPAGTHHRFSYTRSPSLSMSFNQRNSVAGSHPVGSLPAKRGQGTVASTTPPSLESAPIKSDAPPGLSDSSLNSEQASSKTVKVVRTPAPPSEGSPRAGNGKAEARNQRQQELRQTFNKRQNPGGKIETSVVVELYLEATSGLELDAKNAREAIKREAGDAKELTFDEFFDVMLETDRL